MLTIKNNLSYIFDSLTDTNSTIFIYNTDYTSGDLLRSLTLAGLKIYGFTTDEAPSCPEEYHGLPVVCKQDFGKISNEITLICPQSSVAKEDVNQIVPNDFIESDVKHITVFLLDPNEVKGWGWLDYVTELPKIYSEIFPACNECSPAYLKELVKIIPTYLANNIYYYNDYKSKYINIDNSMRFTIANTHKTVNSIHLMGQSFIFGLGLEDKDTIASCLQHKINQGEFEQISGYSCFNHGVIGEELNHMIDKICSLTLFPEDIVIATNSVFAVPSDNIYLDNTGEENNLLYFHYLAKAQQYCKKHKAHLLVARIPSVSDVVNPSEWEKQNSLLNFQRNNETRKKWVNIDEKGTHFALDWKAIGILCNLNGIPFFDLSDTVARPHDFGELFLDWLHLGPLGAERIAQSLYEICNWSTTSTNMNARVRKRITRIDKSYEDEIDPKLKQYIKVLKEASLGKPKNAGVIIINGNPFTLGHRYLIEKALQSVPHLYILVLEEDKSAFSFAERMDLIYKGTADLENVTVLPSGKFVISSVTFPEYFQKDSKQNSTIDASTDINIFGKYIAPALHVTKRFVGEEPYCNITNQYNQQMMEKFPQFGVEFIVLKRLSVGDTAISASLVRKLISENNLKKLKSYLPKTTLDYVLSSPKWNCELLEKDCK